MASPEQCHATHAADHAAARLPRGCSGHRVGLTLPSAQGGPTWATSSPSPCLDRSTGVSSWPDHLPPNVLLVAVEETEGVVGYAAAHPAGGELFLLFVHSVFACRGIGRTFLAAAHDALRASGCREAFLRPRAVRPSARRLHRRILPGRFGSRVGLPWHTRARGVSSGSSRRAPHPRRSSACVLMTPTGCRNHAVDAIRRNRWRQPASPAPSPEPAPAGR